MPTCPSPSHSSPVTWPTPHPHHRCAFPFPDAATSRTFLEGLRAKVQGRSAEAHALLLAELGQLLLDAKEVDRCRKNLTEAEALLDTLPGLEPVVHASFYRVSANVDKVRSGETGAERPERRDRSGETGRPWGARTCTS